MFHAHKNVPMQSSVFGVFEVQQLYCSVALHLTRMSQGLSLQGRLWQCFLSRRVYAPAHDTVFHMVMLLRVLHLRMDQRCSFSTHLRKRLFQLH